VPHLSRLLRKVGFHRPILLSPKSLGEEFVESHVSQKTRDMGHPRAWSRRQKSRFLIGLRPIRNDKVLREGAGIAREARYPQGLKPGYVLWRWTRR
jgi:hypothetical protein